MRSQGRRNFYGGRHNGSHTAQVSPDSPRRTESTTEAAVAAGHDLSGRPGGVDEAGVSFAAAPASAYPPGLSAKIQIRIDQLSSSLPWPAA